MPYVLKNENLQIHIDSPLENYNFSRFDWTGKIAEVKFRNAHLSSVESTDNINEHHFGKGFYNEFGIDSALGFDDTAIGGWFHKIGVGLLKKEDTQYLFSKDYDIIPAEFKTISESNKLIISCKSQAINGYSYELRKEIELHSCGFTINYYLKNTGEKNINTTEYVHNFTAINNDLIGNNYVLRFPFQLKPERFGETVNPELKVAIGPNEVTFNSTPKEPFFFSDLSGSDHVKAEWELTNLEHNIGIRETGSFQTNKVNLWGLTHVISPELFFNIFIKPGESTEWSRNYNIFQLNKNV
ncbi:hypothetical protein [Changchengzhania lutea]|uniref:hypothetical protein n=1 Tax=Changchengzhania lutea TaxID=2049305 RepID=UPI00115F1A90|nr:hypothetical protein [Changchengzhania lutea]